MPRWGFLRYQGPQPGLGTSLPCGYPGCDYVFTPEARQFTDWLNVGDLHAVEGERDVWHIFHGGRWVLMGVEADEMKLRRYREALVKITDNPNIAVEIAAEALDG